MNTQRPASQGKTLLIVEDDILSAIALKQEPEDSGFLGLDLTSRPNEALAAARHGAPDLALVNIELHGRDDGIDLARQFKAMGIPVLFIGGQSSRARTARTVAVGSLPKPYHPADIVPAVHYLLARLAGDDSQPGPHSLEVFEDEVGDAITGPIVQGFADQRQFISSRYPSPQEETRRGG